MRHFRACGVPGHSRCCQGLGFRVNPKPAGLPLRCYDHATLPPRCTAAGRDPRVLDGPKDVPIECGGKQQQVISYLAARVREGILPL